VSNIELYDVRSLPPPYNLSEAVHRCKIELHQMANPVIRKIHIPAISAMEAINTNKTIKKLPLTNGMRVVAAQQHRPILS
jgi:hypothetical protein